MTDVQEILAAFNERIDEFTRKRNENDLMARQVRELEDSVITIIGQLKIGQAALTFLEDLANARRGAMKGKIESATTKAVQFIYDESYGVELSYSVKNNRSWLDIEMTRQTKAGLIKRDIEGMGGGMADTVSTPLRLMVLMGSSQTDRVCLLDEPWKHIDPERVELVGKFLRVLTDDLKIQTIICSHHPGLKDFADRIYDVSERDGVASVKVS